MTGPTYALPAAPPAEALFALPAFGPGVHLMTPEGELPIEWLATGDRLITRADGAQPILWLGRLRLTRERLAHSPAFAPLEIAADALGPGFPTHGTMLAPRSRILLAGAEIELHTGLPEALAEIGWLADDEQVARPAPAAIHYTFVLLPMHGVVQANGLWAETILLDAEARQALAGTLPAALQTDPILRAAHARTTRPCLRDWEVTAMRGPRQTGALHRLIRRAA